MSYSLEILHKIEYHIFSKMKLVSLLFFSFAVASNCYAFPNQQNIRVSVMFDKPRKNQLDETNGETYNLENSMLHDRELRNFENLKAGPEIVEDVSHPKQDSAKQHKEYLKLENSLSDLTNDENPFRCDSFDKFVKKRNTDERNVHSRRGATKGEQKKAKALGRLLMNNGANKNDEDIQDDYADDEDDDYSKGLSSKKMNWEDFRNEDGPSVLELIALNARHKTNVYST